MRKLANIFGNDFLQRMPVIGVGFEGECEFFGMRLGRGSFETRETYTTISLKSLSNFKNPTDGFEIETVITTLEFDSFKKFIKDKRVKKSELVVTFSNLIWSLLLFFPSYRAVQLENILALKFWFDSPLEVYLSISIGIIILVYFIWPKLVMLICGL